MKRNIALSLPSLNEDDEKAVIECLRSGWVMQGPLTAKFEELFAEFIGVNYAVAVSSCTTALHLMMLTLDIQEGDEVIVPAFSWVSTANAVEYVGAKPIFVDVDETFNMDLNHIKEAMTPQTKAIIPVHLFGLCVNIDEIKTKFPNLLIVEDAACAAGSEIHGKNAGAMGEMAAFSFHPRKSITTGEGGMVTTNNEKYYKKLLALRNHGLEPEFKKQSNADMPAVKGLGYNFRITDIQSSIGVTQMKRLHGMINERQKGADIYKEILSDCEDLILPLDSESIKHSWQSYVVLLRKNSGLNRNEIMRKLAESGIATRPGTQALHMLDFYSKKYGIAPTDFPNAQWVYENSIAIPMHNKMSKDDFVYVGEVLRELIT
jgi:dTDP-4-amino-4,6-dideoxygalactose transaminase